MRQSFAQTLNLLRQDIAFRCEYEHKTPGPLTPLKLLLNQGFVSVMLFRFQVFFDQHWLKPLAGVLKWLNLILFSVAIDSRAVIGGGFVVIHAHSIYISDRVTIGRNVLIFVANAIGFTPFFEGDAIDVRGPIIGDNVILGAGAAVYGPITVGDGCKIAVNSAVDCDCPPGSVMFGVPARQVSQA